MQIQNQVNSKQLSSTEKSLELKQGDIVHAKVKDAKPNGEAILQIRGKEFKAQFDGKAPLENRATVQITGQKDGVLHLKTVSEGAVSPESTEQPTALKNLGIMTGKESPELKQAVNHLLGKGVPLSKDALNDLKSFFEKASGTPEQKFETVKALAGKSLEVTENHLRSVHDTLHGKPLNKSLGDLVEEVEPDFKFSQVKAANLNEVLKSIEGNPLTEKAIQEAKKLQAIGQNRMNQAIDQALKNINLTAEEKQGLTQIKDQIKQNISSSDILKSIQQMKGNIFNDLEKLAKQALQLEKAGLDRLNQSVNENDPAAKLTELKSLIQKNPNLLSAIDLLKDHLPKILNQNQIAKMEQVLTESNHLNDRGRELKARQVLMQGLEAIEQELTQMEPSQRVDQKQSNELEQYNINDKLQGLVLQSKDIIVTKITQKLAELTHEFKNLKREITRNLDSIQHLMKTSKPQAKQMLESTIKKIDQAILKSDIMLFTDMKTEKQLLQVSSQLAEAKKLLGKGQTAEAHRIVSDIKAVLEKLNFKPSDVKVKHYASQQSLAIENRSASQELASTFDEIATRPVLKQEPSARQAFELIRSLGLNHDSEAARNLVFQQSGEQTEQEPSQRNLKEILMRLMQGEGKPHAEQALSNLTGQQLLSKSDSGHNLQSMLFQLPYLLEDKVENLQVYVNSKKEGQQVDWENCNLYFLIETKKLGEVGISLNVTDKNLSITLKNDQQLFKEKMEPIANITKEKLQDIGYNVNHLNFAKMTNEGGMKKTESQRLDLEESKMKKSVSSKGMDFKI